MEGEMEPGLLEKLTDPRFRVASAVFPGALAGLDLPGLYTWWVDEAGAGEISQGLGHSISAGLIYAGRAGAGMSKRNLLQRIGRNHRRGNIAGSTFRRTLAAVLRSTLRLESAGPSKLTGESERRLSEWIDAHLFVAVCPLSDRAMLLVAEAQLLTRLDPPLNLEGMASTPVRERLSLMRGELARVEERKTGPNGALLCDTRAARPAILSTASESLQRIDALALLGGLVGKTITTLTGRPNRILALNDSHVTVATGKSPNGENVPVEWVQAALDRLVRDGAIEINVESVGYRSAFIGAVLATVPGARADLRPRRVSL